MGKVFKDPDGVWFHGLALFYILLMYVLGLAGLFSSSWLFNFISTLCLAHAMTIAAYMVHEAGHNTIFSSTEANTRLGRVLTWFCGASYGKFEDIRFKHFRHHVDNDDIVWFDHTRFFREHPVVKRIVEGLEWMYIPAHDLLMHFIMVFTSFIIPARRDQRLYNVSVIAIRAAIYFSVLIIYPKAAILYAIAYMIMMHILRFMDALQHDYGYHLTLFSNERSDKRGDAEYEQAHTFSNPHTLRWDWPNWFTLNFGFHNVHHAQPTVPWYRLPALHREFFGDNPDRVIPFSSQLKIFHKYRVERVSIGEAEETEELLVQDGEDFLVAAREAKVTGGNAASFLTAF